MSVGSSERKQKIKSSAEAQEMQKNSLNFNIAKTELSTSDGRDYTEKKKSKKRNRSKPPWSQQTIPNTSKNGRAACNDQAPIKIKTTTQIVRLLQL